MLDRLLFERHGISLRLEVSNVIMAIKCNQTASSPEEKNE